MRVIAFARQLAQCRHASTALKQCITTLPNVKVESFREVFLAELPALLPGIMSSLPAIKKWFIISDQPNMINASYLAQFGANTVPLEFTNGATFLRMQQPLSYFLECLASTSSTHVVRYFTPHTPGRSSRRGKTITFTKAAPISPQTSIYLAQAPIADLPRALREDVPTPEIIKQIGKGDVYDSSIWIGTSPTYTPLHRDPNPNFFVQLSGSKSIRLFRPEIGRGIFSKVQEMIGGDASAAIRGEEMMAGQERAALDKEVWHADSEYRDSGFTVQLRSGDALFIPKGWWHSVKSVSKGVNGSANWWFR